MTCQPSHPNKMGRPREWDRDKILDEFLEWVKQPDSINLNKFCGTREPMLDPSKLSQWAREDDNFRRAYWAGKSLLAARREEWLCAENLHQKAYHLSNQFYNHFDKEESRDEFKFQKELEAAVGKEVNASANVDVKERLDATLNQLSELQSSLKSAKININKEEKS